MQAAGAKAVTTVLCRDLPSERRLEVVGRALETIKATGSQSMRELHRLLDVMRGDGEHDKGAPHCATSPPSRSAGRPGRSGGDPCVSG